MLIHSTELSQFKCVEPVLNPLRPHEVNISCLIIPTDVAKVNFRQRKRTIPKTPIQRFLAPAREKSRLDSKLERSAFTAGSRGVRNNPDVTPHVLMDEFRIWRRLVRTPTAAASLRSQGQNVLFADPFRNVADPVYMIEVKIASFLGLVAVESYFWLTLNPLWDLRVALMCSDGYSHYLGPSPHTSLSGDRALLLRLTLPKCSAVLVSILLASS